MAVTLVPDDLTPFAEIPEAKALAMIEDAMALAATIAPCITDPAFTNGAAAKAIIRGAILRWNEAGTGALQSQSVDDYSYTVDTRHPARRGLFFPSEITQLQDLCKTGGPAGAFTVDMAPAGGGIEHADICALRFGATYCSCGAVLTGALPLWEQTP